MFCGLGYGHLWEGHCSASHTVLAKVSIFDSIIYWVKVVNRRSQTLLEVGKIFTHSHLDDS